MQDDDKDNEQEKGSHDLELINSYSTNLKKNLEGPNDIAGLEQVNFSSGAREKMMIKIMSKKKWLTTCYLPHK